MNVSTIGPVISRGRTVRGADMDEGDGGGLGRWGIWGTTMSASALSMVVRRRVKPMVFGTGGAASAGEPERDGAVHEEETEETEDWRPRAHGRGSVVSGDWKGTDQFMFT